MINGILNLYKPAGWTSNDVVCKLRGILHQKKIGHTGTLDPNAIGVLPVCLGHATKVCELLTDEKKTYSAVMRLGITTDTQDTSGQVLSKKKVSCTFHEVKAIAESFLGSYDQIPPMYSARKVNGKKLYEYARAGVEVARKAKTVTIHSVSVEPYHSDPVFHPIGEEALPAASDADYFILHVCCSKGTYIRTFIHDIGEKLGCGAAMAALVRTQVGMFHLEQAFSIERVQELADNGDVEKIITGVDELFCNAPKCVPAGKKTLERILNGNSAAPCYLLCTDSDADTSRHTLSDAGSLPEQIRVYDDEDSFLALYGYDKEQNLYTPVKMFTVRTV